MEIGTFVKCQNGTDDFLKDLGNTSCQGLSDENNSVELVNSGYDQLGQLTNDKVINLGEEITQAEEILSTFIELQCAGCKHKPTFNFYKSLVEHCKTEHQGDTELKCCDLSFWTREDLLKHLLAHSLYRCLQCGKSFCNASSYSLHCKQHSPGVESEFTCSHCSKQFNSKYSLVHHMNLHLPESERPHTCRHCGKGFATKNAMGKHERTHLPDAEKLNYVCDVCGKRFGYASTLFAHQKHVHSEERPFSCPICAKTFPIKGALTYHLTTHQKQKKVQCDHCGKWLKNDKVLQIHKKRHEGLLHKCPHCDKVSATRNNLRVHILRHSDERPHPCPLCLRAFKTSKDLTTHKIQHTGLKPYSCPYCPRTFASPSNFYAHRKKKHAANNQETLADLRQRNSDEAVS